MKRLPLIVFAAASALALSACAGFSVPGMATAGAGSNQAMASFLSDPACAHHDEANFVSGAAGVPASFQAKVVRDCPAHAVAPPAPAPALAPGAVVAPAAPTTPPA